MYLYKLIDVDVHVDVDVNEFSHRLICTSWSACLLALLAQEESSCPVGRPRPCEPTTAETRSSSGRRAASRVQAYSQQSTTTSTITSTSTSTSTVCDGHRSASNCAQDVQLIP